MTDRSDWEEWHIDPEEEILTRKQVASMIGATWASRFLKGRGSISVAEMLKHEPVPDHLLTVLFFERRNRRPLVHHDVIVESSVDKLGLFSIQRGLLTHVVWSGLPGEWIQKSFHFSHPLEDGESKDLAWHPTIPDHHPKLQAFLKSQSS